MERKLKLLFIEDGIVIDHITGGQAPNILKVLDIKGGTKEKVDIIMNVESSKTGTKDIVKIEGKAIDSTELNKIALITQTATINVIKSYKVIKKYKVKLPERVEGILKCLNPSCISNNPKEPISPKFVLKEKEPVVFECYYCARTIETENLMEAMEN